MASNQQQAVTAVPGSSRNVLLARAGSLATAVTKGGQPAAPVTKTISVTTSPHKKAYILLPVKDASGKIKGATRVMITAPKPVNSQQQQQRQLPLVNVAAAAQQNQQLSAQAADRIKQKQLRALARAQEVSANIPDPPELSGGAHGTAPADRQPLDDSHQSQLLESHKRHDNPNCNFTTSERTFVLMALAVARDRLDKTPNWEKPREGFSSILCQEVREILDEPSFRHVVRKSNNYIDGERKSPSDNVIRDIWTSFLKNGTPARANNGGRRRNEEVRLKIRELLEQGNYSSREVATITGASRALVCNFIKEFNEAKKGKAGGAKTKAKSAAAAKKDKTPDANKKQSRPRAKKKTATATATEAAGQETAQQQQQQQQQQHQQQPGTDQQGQEHEVFEEAMQDIDYLATP